MEPDPQDFQWQARAACRGRGRLSDDELLALCDDCPVQPECLAFAIKYEMTHFIWGGLREDERLRRRLCYQCGAVFVFTTSRQRFCERHTPESSRQ